MDEKEKKLREDLEFHLDTLRRNLEVVSMEDLKAKYAKPFKDLKDNICKTATAYTQYISLAQLFQQSACHIGHRLPVSLTVGAAVFQLVGDPLRQIGGTQ